MLFINNNNNDIFNQYTNITVLMLSSLSEIGVDLAQGFGIEMPKPLTEVLS